MKKTFKKTIGLFGGSFDPPHKGHEYVIETCLNELNLSKIYLIPSYQTPGKIKSQTQDRFTMIQKVFHGRKKVEVLDVEIKRKGVSYTIDTLKELNFSEECSLIMGEDVFLDFPKWKSFQEILNRVHLVVFLKTQEKLSLKSFPLSFSKLIQQESETLWKLKNGNQIIFQPFHKSLRYLSSSQIRNQIKLNQFKKENVSETLCLGIDKYYGYLKSFPLKEMEKDLFKFLEEKGGLNSRMFYFEKRFYESLLVTSGLNSRHVHALAKSLKSYVGEKYRLKPHHIEGEEHHQWVVFDYGFLIVHIFYDYLRKYYQLEEVWEHQTHLSTKQN